MKDFEVSAAEFVRATAVADRTMAHILSARTQAKIAHVEARGSWLRSLVRRLLRGR